MRACAYAQCVRTLRTVPTHTSHVPQYVQVLKVAFSLKLLKLLKNPLFAFNFELFVPEKVKVVNLTVTLNFFLL